MAVQDKDALLAQIQALFPDNNTRDISAVDLRTQLIDMVDSLVTPPREIMVAESILDQDPVGLDTPLQIEFGALQSTPEIDLAADGAITVKVAGTYLTFVSLYFSRPSSAGNAFFFIRSLLGGVQQGNPIAVEQTDDDITVPIFISLFSEVGAVPAVFTTECVRDGQGIDSGGLHGISSTIGWGQTPSARIRVLKLD